MRLLLTLPVVAAAIGLAAPAYADDSDQTFISDLRNADIHFKDADQAETAGRSVCELKGGGMSDADIISNLEEQNPGFADDKAAKFDAIATSVYCPPDATETSSPG
jgi:hypothetical protein